MLQISHLSADYGGKPALADINLTLESGELLVVLGPSGCGKTTLLNLIAGFVPYQHGSITLEGQRVTGPGAERGVIPFAFRSGDQRAMALFLDVAVRRVDVG